MPENSCCHFQILISSLVGMYVHVCSYVSVTFWFSRNIFTFCLDPTGLNGGEVAKYFYNDYILSGVQLNEVPLFRKISDLMDIENNLYFDETGGIDKHYHSYIIKPTTEKKSYFMYV